MSKSDIMGSIKGVFKSSLILHLLCFSMHLICLNMSVFVGFIKTVVEILADLCDVADAAGVVVLSFVSIPQE